MIGNLSYTSFPDIETVISILKEYDFLVNVFPEISIRKVNKIIDYKRDIKNSKSDLNYLNDRVFHFPMYDKKRLSWACLDNFVKTVEFILNNLHEKKIMIHCRSGLHRSKMVYDAVYYVINGSHNPSHNMLIPNCNAEYILFPIKLDEMEKLLLETKNKTNFVNKNNEQK